MLGKKIRERKEKIKENLSDNQKILIRKILRFFLFFSPYKGNLDILAVAHETDKFSHGYLKYYKQYFSPIRKKKLKILEIGVGKPWHPEAGGGSLRMWRDYFSNSIIYSIDIEDKQCHQEKRIIIFKGSQDDTKFLKEVVAQIGSFDIIIDDGSHVNKHVLTSFFELFPCLKEEGIYVVEDVQTSYWPKYGGCSEQLDNVETTMSTFKNLSDGLNYQYIHNRKPTYFDKNIVSIHFYPNIVFFFKGKNEIKGKKRQIKDGKNDDTRDNCSLEK